MADLDEREIQPLLVEPSSPSSPPISTLSSRRKPSSSSSTEEAASIHDALLSRSIDNDVLPETSTLGRNLSWQSAYILVISRVIGSGIFATPGAIIRSVGSIGLTLSLWSVGAIIAACGLSVALEYGCMLPRSGGEKVYLEFTYRRPRFLASTLVVFLVVLLGFTASNCIVFSEYVLFALRVTNPSEALRKGLAAGLLTAVTIIHGCFRKQGIWIQNALGWLKVGLIVFMILSGLYVVSFGRRTSGFAGLEAWDDLWTDSNWNWGTISTALFKVFYSYAGLDNANNVMNEVKDPVKTLRSVSLTALVTACILYLLINVAYFIVVPIDVIKSSGELVGGLFFRGVFGPHIGGIVLPLAVALSAVGNVMVVAFALARVKQEIARQGFLPFSRILSSTKPFNSPLGGLIVNFIPSFLVIIFPPSKEVYSFILEVEGYPAQFVAISLAFGLIWLRFTRPDIERPFKAWIPAVLLRISLSLALIAAPFFPPDKPQPGLFYASYAIVGVGIILSAILYWYVWTVALPWWGGYKLEEEVDVLDDGTTITKLVKVSR